MRAPLHPIGILVANSLPVALLLFLYGGMLSIVKPLLGEESVELWTMYGGLLIALVVLSTLYATIAWRKQKNVSAIYAGLIFLSYVPLLWGFMENYSLLVPWEIPRWMMPEDAELFALRLLSIPLAHALFVLVTVSLPEGDRGSPLRDILMAAAIPLACYVFVQVIEPWRLGIDFERHVWTVLFVTIVIAFLFFLFRGVLALVQRRSGTGKGMGVVVTLLIALVFPLLGLAINNGDLTDFFSEAHGVFGDLSHPAFYIIAVLNAAVILWPSSENPRVRLLQFVLRSAGFSYVLYFFVLFLPLLPISIVAIIAIGIGFLLLAPVLLFIVQSLLLFKDARFLAAHRSRTSLVAIMLGAMLVLPAIITVRYLHHRTVLTAALEHVYQSDPSAEAEHLDTTALSQVLDQVASNRSRGGGWSKRNTPFLTPYYNWLVLDNLSLSDDKLGTLRAVFLNEPMEDNGRNNWGPPSDHVRIDSIQVKSVYDEQQQAWRSWAHLRMHNSGQGQEEFVTEIDLPDGAWICDDYLVIGADTAKGVLAEKKAAMWVYNNIVNYRRDPSMMRYTAPGRVQLRVFPFAQDEVRRAGFEVLHKEAFQLIVSTDTLLLGDTLHALPQRETTTGDGAITYIPSGLKAKLPLVKRTPHYHFIVDGTEAQRHTREEVIARVQAWRSREALDPANIHLHIADAYGVSLPFNGAAFDAYTHHVGEGGFFSDRIIRKLITGSCTEPSEEYPVIVIVPSAPSFDHQSLGTWLDDLSEVADCIPEGGTFLVLGENGEITHKAFKEPVGQLNHELYTLQVPQVRAWPNAQSPGAYLRDGTDGDIVVNTDKLGAMSTPQLRSWSHALDLEGRWRAYQLHPQGGTAAWRELVRGSFQAQVMLPVTAWMCLEDDAQRNALLKKQEDMLSGNAALDASDQNITNMSEPDLLWLLLPVLLWFVLRKRRVF